MIAELAEIITAVAALAAVVVSLWNGRKIQDIHIAINSRMDQLLELTKSAEHARGMKEQSERDEAAGH